MVWRHHNFEFNDGKTPNSSVCWDCGWEAGRHWDKTCSSCPTGEAYPKRLGFPMYGPKKKKDNDENLRYVIRRLRKALTDAVKGPWLPADIQYRAKDVLADTIPYEVGEKYGWNSGPCEYHEEARGALAENMELRKKLKETEDSLLLSKQILDSVPKENYGWSRSREVPRWQTIASVPKGGTAILIRGSQYITAGFWDSVAGCLRTHQGHWVIDTATHWMPLPEVPRS